MVSTEFQYAKLSTRSTIRLIDTIVCVLWHAEQTDIEYCALSYVWGDSTPTREIHIKTDDAADSESFIFPLHENLWRFLDWAWNQGKFDRWFWTNRSALIRKMRKRSLSRFRRWAKYTTVPSKWYELGPNRTILRARNEIIMQFYQPATAQQGGAEGISKPE
ncbi:hypothetical protein IWX90DRAFT_265835 [Phyllosticta citrichinensis]|uniref:Heterokaryon incompatibility domain-containing protein n=1 Tax=Phyllosticta citrichinensis TaxID=1130410 RepID=A0ABR1XMB9_9PEZI